MDRLPDYRVKQAGLFITGNLLRDNSGWKEGFKQSIIWQIDKWKGYNGEPWYIISIMIYATWVKPYGISALFPVALH